MTISRCVQQLRCIYFLSYILFTFQSHPNAKSWCKKEFPQYEALDALIRDTVTTGERAFHPGSKTLAELQGEVIDVSDSSDQEDDNVVCANYHPLDRAHLVDGESRCWQA